MRKLNLVISHGSILVGGFGVGAHINTFSFVCGIVFIAAGVLQAITGHLESLDYANAHIGR